MLLNGGRIVPSFKIDGVPAVQTMAFSPVSYQLEARGWKILITEALIGSVQKNSSQASCIIHKLHLFALPLA